MPKVTEQRAVPPMGRDEIASRVEALRATVYDRSAVFSRSQILLELHALAGEAEARGDMPDAQRDALLMIGLVESKGGDAKDVVTALEWALDIKAVTPLPAERQARTHHLLAEHLQIREEYAAAAVHYRLAIRHMAATPAFNEDQRLGTGQELGFVLHEAKKYQDALDSNLEVLTGGERIHGADSPLLRTLLVNIAQNLHALGRKPEAEPYLVRALAMARAEGKIWNEQDLLFQLGVLAFETGRNDEALKRMRERIGVIKKNNRKDLIASANEDLQILEDKIRTGRR
jgi:tetratricopeptide (TPR) repeat protein